MRALILLVLVASATAHLCLLSPLQRAPNNNFNQIGASDCAVIAGPCGTSTASAPQIFFEAGQNATIVFQKNENHWVAPSPGNFTVNLILPQMNKPINLGVLADGNTPSLSIFTVDVKIPNAPTKAGILQVIYNTGNPAVPPQFYQCADVGIF